MIITRSYALDDATTDGRTMTIRCVPLDTVAVVRDNGGPAYREKIAPGAFRKLAGAAHRVALRTGHDYSAFSDVGKGMEFSERDGALVGVFRVDESPFGDHALFKVRDGQWPYASIGAAVLKSRQDGDVTVRTLLHLDHVALTDSPAYTGAEVLSVRDDPAPRMARWIGKYPLRCE